MPQSLAELLERFVDEERARLDDTYQWSIPEPLPECAFDRDNDSHARANSRLKRALSAAWHNQPKHRGEIEQWFVVRWGRIRRNNAETMRRYASSTAEQLVEGGLSGIASWSKILVVRDPERYAIYDARVGAALNALQVVHRLEEPLLFPKVPSQNTVIREYQRNEVTVSDNARSVPKGSAYTSYLALIGQVAKKLCVLIDVPEMTLFANATRLANDALLNLR